VKRLFFHDGNGNWHISESQWQAVKQIFQGKKQQSDARGGETLLVSIPSQRRRLNLWFIGSRSGERSKAQTLNHRSFACSWMEAAHLFFQDVYLLNRILPCHSCLPGASLSAAKGDACQCQQSVTSRLVYQIRMFRWRLSGLTHRQK
jgi:hypothetical protein